MNSKWTQLQKKPQKSRKKTAIIIVVALLVLAGLTFAGYKYLDHRRVEKENAKHAAQEAAQNQQIKEQTADRDKNSGSSSSTKDDPATDQSKNAGDVPVLSTDLGVVINRITQNNAGAPISVRATVSGTTVGTCTVTFSKSGQADVVKTFDVEYSAAAVSCGAADVDASALPTDGQWNVKVTVTSDGKISSPATGQVQVKK